MLLDIYDQANVKIDDYHHVIHGPNMHAPGDMHLTYAEMFRMNETFAGMDVSVRVGPVPSDNSEEGYFRCQLFATSTVCINRNLRKGIGLRDALADLEKRMSNDEVMQALSALPVRIAMPVMRTNLPDRL